MLFKLYIILFVMTSLSAIAQESIIINGENGNIHYKSFGKGTPILIINGGPGLDCAGFEPIASEFAERGFQVIIFDQSGTGKSSVSEKNAQTIALSVIVEDMETLRQHLQLEKWTLMGQSFGGMVAAAYAKQYPKRIQSLIFSSSAGLNLDFLEEFETQLHKQLTPSQIDSLQLLNTAIDNGDTSAETLLSYSEILAKAYVFNKDKSASIAKRLLQVDYSIHTLIMDNLKTQKFDLSNSFTNFHEPVLILQGLHDVISEQTARKIATAFPNSKLVLLEKCGHYPWLDSPEKFWKTIHSFLQ